MSDVVNTDFPVWALLPKKETGVTNFLNKYPNFDGRGVLVAIFDSGVDPSADGLKVTTDGKVKVVERYDCTGAGDVDTSAVATLTDNVVTGLTGRKLTFPPEWEIPTGTCHLGIKSAFELYPHKLLERMKKERKEKLWDPTHKKSVATATRRSESDSPSNENNLSGLEKLRKEDKEAELDLLANFEKKYEDVGPIYDCVLFHNGTHWRLCIDTSEKGDLADGVVLDEYSVSQQYAFLTSVDLLAISFNVYEDGNVLEIVSMCSPHGTHVASIAAANFPDEPEKNGVAPGAQIISFTIGDTRLTSMETGTGLVRAMIHVMKRHGDKPVHVINMSYGEHAHWSCAGRIGELMVDIVDKYQTTFVASAGNHGPALCTIGTPPDINADCLIGVGAYVSPDMMAAEYAMIEKMPGMPYTWSSRGPTIDGGAGVSVCAPGGAITSVPYFTLRNSQLMNGTSMAAPHVTGVIALLISGMIQNNYKYSPQSIRRAIENTALFLNDVDAFSQGKGLIQVEKAFDHLCAHHEAMERDIRFSVQCGTNGAKGLHYRRGLLDSPKEWVVNIEPVFIDKDDYNSMFAFNMNLSLVCSAPWIQIPSHLAMSNVSRSIVVRMDPKGLTEGIHTTCIRAYDTSCVEKGPVFNIPVTAVKPIVLEESNSEFSQRNILFKSHTIQRHFILVPERSSWVVLKLRCPENDKSGKFIVHAVQLFPKRVCKTMEFYKMFTISGNSDVIHAFPCRGGVIVEVVIAKYWSSTSQMLVDYDIEFRGVIPNYPSVTMQGADGIFTVDVASGVRNEEIAPAVSLKSSVLVIRPSENKITACCKERDVIPPCRQIYENILTYNIHIWKACEVTPICPLLSDLLYESEYESQLWMLYDSNKQLLMTGDAYPSKYCVKLEKGDYVLKLNVRHEKKDLLEKLVDMPLLISQKLCQPINMDVYVSLTQAMIQGKKMAGAAIPRGRLTLPIYISPLTNDKMTKNMPVGHYLQGTISYAKDEIGKKIDVYPFKYVVPEAVKKSKSENNKDKEKDKQKVEEVNDSIRDFYISLLAKLEPGEKADEVYEKLKAEHPDNLQVLTARLTCLDSTDHKRFGVLPFFNTDGIEESKISELRETCESVIAICDVVISNVDSVALLSQLAMKVDGRSEATKAKQAAEKQKTALLEALARKGCAVARLNALDAPGEPSADIEQLNDIWREIIKFVEPNDLKVINFMAWHAVALKQYSRAIRFLLKMAEEKSSLVLDQKIAEICRLLEWHHINNYIANQVYVRYPKQYRRF